MMILRWKSCCGGYDGNHEDEDKENKEDKDNVDDETSALERCLTLEVCAPHQLNRRDG